jgi:nucleoside-specific outer membrane channel protein Tsx
LPYTFFPTNFARYIPYIDYRAEEKLKNTSTTRTNDVFRAVAVIATSTIAHGEELYLDYFQDQRHEPLNIEYTPDWLLEPPAMSPFLQKKEFVA